MAFDIAKIFSGAASEMFSGLVPLATAQALAVGLSSIAGSTPAVLNHGDYAEIIFTPAQEARVSEWILTQLRREPGPVRVQANGIAWKVITRQYWPYMLGAVALGAAVGYSMRKGAGRG